MAELYEVNAEFYDLGMTPFRATQMDQIAAMVESVEPTHGPFVELGAGTGIATAILARAMPEARIVAVEPANPLRAILMAKLAANLDLRRRVTVVASDLAGFAWPERIAGFGAFGVIGHFDEAERRALWRTLRRVLGPGAPVIVELMRPHQPIAVPLNQNLRETVGDFTYEGWNSAEPAGGSTLRWTMTFRVLRDEQLIREGTTTSLYEAIAPETLVADVTDAGLVFDREEDGLVLCRQPGEGE